MEEKITIIEGPPPTFEILDEGWAFGLAEGPVLSDIAVTHLRTFNGPALVERCHRAWRNQLPINLEYRENDGLEKHAPILAARTLETDGGQVLVLWVRLQKDDTEVEFTIGDDETEFEDFEDESEDYDVDEEDFDDLDDEIDDDFFDSPDDNSLLPPTR
jgi:hypothetical protein